MQAKPTPEDFSLSQEDIARIGRIQAAVSDNEIGSSWVDKLLPERKGFFAGLIGIVTVSVLGPFIFLGIIASPIIQFFASIRRSIDPKSKNFDAYRLAIHEYEKTSQQAAHLKTSSNELSLVGRSVVQPRVQESQSKPDSADSLPPADPPHIPPAGWNPTPITPFLHEGLRVGTEKPLAGETQADAESITTSKTSKPRKIRNPKPKKELPTKGEILPDHFFEGATREVKLTTYERDPRARRACLEHHGSRCAACGIDYIEKYGELGEGVIQVHHLRPLSKIAKKHKVNPITDLIPVCPTCHVMLHRHTPPLLPETLRQHLLERGQIEAPSEIVKIDKRKPLKSKGNTKKQTSAESVQESQVIFPKIISTDQLELGVMESYDARFPSDRLEKMAKVANSLIATGITTPELLAVTLDRLDPRCRKFSNHFWELFCEVDPTLSKTVDWKVIYQTKDAKTQSDHT